jgi:DNA-binding CsgD family transcriptional regulator
MDVSSAQMERACAHFKKSLSGITDNVIHVSYSLINQEKKSIYTLSTDYDWHLCYWDEDLHQSVSKRMIPGISVWAEKNQAHRELMERHHIPFKTDYTISSGSESSEILSIASQRCLTSREFHSLSLLRPLLSHQAHLLWQKNGVQSLPFQSIPLESEHALQLTAISPKFQFGHIILTEKEMSTIRALLSLKTIKEIAWLHQCSEAAEKKRVETIKQKLGCQNASRSALFQMLKKHGVIDACLDVYVTSS